MVSGVGDMRTGMKWIGEVDYKKEEDRNTGFREKKKINVKTIRKTVGENGPHMIKIR